MNGTHQEFGWFAAQLASMAKHGYEGKEQILEGIFDRLGLDRSVPGLDTPQKKLAWLRENRPSVNGKTEWRKRR